MVISILGCGWLGVPLANDLMGKGHVVKGSTTSQAKLTMLEANGIVPFLIRIDGPENSVWNDVFFECDVLVIAINNRTTDSVSYLSKIEAIRSKIQHHQIKKVILISSIGVYGERNKRVDEQTPPDPETSSGKVIWQAECLLKAIPNVSTMALCFGGLVGPSRHPGRFLAGKTGIPNGQAPVNLIHLFDGVAIGRMVIENEMSMNTLNAVCPDHPSRESFYKKAAETTGRTPPDFIAEKNAWKIVNSLYLSDALRYHFQVSDWNLALDISDLW